MGEIENRYIDFENAELRTLEENDEIKIAGYYAKFGTFSEDLGGFYETIEHGFFHDALRTSDVVDLFNHDPNYPLGRKSVVSGPGSLRVWEDNIGLAYELSPVDTTMGRDLIKLIDTRVIIGNSFGFMIKNDGARFEKLDGFELPVRILSRNGCKELFDGSQVTFPAYNNTDIARRSFELYKSGNAEEGNMINDEKIKIQTLSLRVRRLLK
jgi:HK97 family phage prohead protease